MQIAYCFIEDDVNIDGQGINFGSPYIFSTALTDNGYELTREVNANYVPNLFRRKTNNLIDNVSAIVGENGSGKTNLMNFLINGLEHSPFGNYGFILFIDEKDKVVLFNGSIRNLSADFTLEVQKFDLNYAGIYYNPIYDFQDRFRVNDTQVIDVSSNTLMYYDYYDDQFFNKGLDMIQMHKFKNVTRQVRFIISQKQAQKIRQYITLPRTIDVVFIDPEFDHDGEGIDNVSYDFRPFYKMGVDLWRSEKEKIQSRQYHAFEKSARHRKNDPFAKELAYIDILLYIWKFLFYTQEKNNSTLEEGYLSSLSEDDPSLLQLKFEDYITRFLRDQNDIFDADSIIVFLNVLKEVFKKIKDVNENNGYISISCSPSQVERILDAYDVMTDKLSSLLYGKPPNTFLNFNWRTMSSGERAFLDLFARVDHAVSIIDRKISSSNNFRTPDYLYLFFDEGEVGFHLQWQKEYVNILMDILPRIVRLKNVEKQPKMQLIFTTHSPISLSDIPRYNTVYLARNEKGQMHVISENDSPKYSFGANVHEIMYDAFYLKDGFTGNFSKSIIDELFQWLNGEKENVRALSASYVKKVIGLVDDPILRIKLEESYAQKMGLNIEQEVLAVKIRLMQKRLAEIQSQQNDQNK